MIGDIVRMRYVCWAIKDDDNKKGDNPRQIDWLPNRNFVFCRNDNTWHSYKADGKNNRLALVYNLRSDKYWKK